VLFPLTDAGLRSRLTTVVGLDYAVSSVVRQVERPRRVSSTRVRSRGLG
jgi:hypothetical protein